MTTPVPEEQDFSLLVRATAIMVLSMIPVLGVAGFVFAFYTLTRAIRERDTVSKVLCIIALIFGAFSIVQTLFLGFFFLQGSPTPGPE